MYFKTIQFISNGSDSRTTRMIKDYFFGKNEEFQELRFPEIESISLTSNRTASASELIVNGFKKPYMDVS